MARRTTSRTTSSIIIIIIPCARELPPVPVPLQHAARASAGALIMLICSGYFWQLDECQPEDLDILLLSFIAPT